MAIGTTAAIVAGVAAVGLAGASVYSSTQARRQSQRQLDFQRQQAELSANRQRRDQVRAARIAYADSQVTSEGQGAADSSGGQGALGSIVSQLGSNLGFSIQMDLISDQIGVSQGKQLNAQGRAALFNAGSQLAAKAVQFA